MKTKMAIALLAAASTVMSGGVAHAAPSPVTQVELNVEPSDFVAMPITFDPSASRTQGITALKELRSRMWDTNPYFRPSTNNWPDGTRLQDVARQYGITTKQEYLDVASDENLTWIAIQRAAEASQVFSHDRPDGTQHSTATRNGYHSSGESLAAGMATLSSAILNSWGGEKEYTALKRSRGVWNYRNGHLMHMLNPRYKAYGFGAVTNPEATGYGGTSFAAATIDQVQAPDNLPSGQRTEWIYRAHTATETPTGLKEGKPNRPAPGATTPTDTAIGSTQQLLGGSETAGVVAAIIVGLITLLGVATKVFGPLLR